MKGVNTYFTGESGVNMLNGGWIELQATKYPSTFKSLPTYNDKILNLSYLLRQD